MQLVDQAVEQVDTLVEQKQELLELAVKEILVEHLYQVIDLLVVVVELELPVVMEVLLELQEQVVQGQLVI
tara:strand:- start:200 stop:412 length:213 start_codon:yes stop_codon:yes gene_type:complete